MGSTIVVKFAANGASNAEFIVAELDDTLNLGEDGKPKTQFYPGDEVYFYMQYGDKVTITSMNCTAGTISDEGIVSRNKTIEQLFALTTETYQLPFMPSGDITVKWYGNTAIITKSNYRDIIANNAPAVGDLTIDYTVHLYKLTPPDMTLGVDDKFPIYIVIEAEGA